MRHAASATGALLDSLRASADGANQYNLLFRWLIGLSMDDTVWVPTVFIKNRQRLVEHDDRIEAF